MTMPITPVGSYGCTGCCANSGASTATYDASNDCTAQSRLRNCIGEWHHYRQPEKK